MLFFSFDTSGNITDSKIKLIYAVFIISQDSITYQINCMISAQNNQQKKGFSKYFFSFTLRYGNPA